MKINIIRIILAFGLLYFVGKTGISQTEIMLYEQGFEGPESSWDIKLNAIENGASDQSCHEFLVNNVYKGGLLILDGVDYTVPDIADQPIDIANAPNSNYLHIVSKKASENNITNANFCLGTTDCGDCGTETDILFTPFTKEINTLGKTGVTLRFWWLCQGGYTDPLPPLVNEGGRVCGEVFYSIDGGVSWKQIDTSLPNNGLLYGSNSWEKEEVHLDEFDNQKDLRFGYRFVLDDGDGLFTIAMMDPQDPSFSVDQIEVFYVKDVVTDPTITLKSNSPLKVCPDSDIKIPFISTGNFESDNEFILELSDENGSFDNPTSIGALPLSGLDLTGAVVGTLINSIPMNGNYHVRIKSTSPEIFSGNSIELQAPEQLLKFRTAYKSMRTELNLRNLYFTGYGGFPPYTFQVAGPGIDLNQNLGKFYDLPLEVYTATITDNVGCKVNMEVNLK